MLKDAPFTLPLFLRKQWGWLFLASVLLLGALIYAPVRRFEFLGFDDPAYISANPWLAEGLHWRGIRWAFEANLVAHSEHAEYWSPLTLLSRLAEAQWFGLNPGAFHVSNVLLHLLNAVLVAFALRQLTANTARACAVALLFLIQAQNVEPVCWLSARKDLLSATFYLATLLAYGWYAKKQTRSRFALVGLLFAACLMSKPMGVSLPFLLCLLDFWPLGRWSSEGKTLSGRARLLAEKIPLLVMAAAAAALAVRSQYDWEAVASTKQLGLSLRLGNAILSCALYLRRLVWPVDLAIFYPHPGAALTWLRVLPAALMLVAITVAAWSLRRRAPVVLTGWLWFVLIVGPVIGIVQIGAQAMADRYAYLATLGPLMALVWLVSDYAPMRYRFALGVSALVAGVFFSAVQVLTWQNDYSVFSHAIAVTSGNGTAQMNLGCALLVRGRTHAAEVRLRQAVESTPHLADGWTHLGEAEIILGHDREAVHCLASSLSIRPADAQNMLLIGLLEKKLGEPDRAEAAFLHMKQTVPSDPASRLELGRLYAAGGAWEKAAAAWTEYLQLRPHDQALAQLRDEAARRAAATPVP